MRIVASCVLWIAASVVGCGDSDGGGGGSGTGTGSAATSGGGEGGTAAGASGTGATGGTSGGTDGGGSGGDSGAGGTAAGASGTGATGGTSGGTGSTATAPDPCELLTAEEWAPLMEDTPVVESPIAGRCEWTHEGGGPPATRRQWGNMTVSVAGAYGTIPMSEPIDIGDEGYQSTIAIARTIDIGWKKGDFSATFKYSALVVPDGKTWDELRAAAIELARDAADRMP